MKPRRIPLDSNPDNLTRTLGLSSILGAGVIIVFAGTSILGLNIENIGASLLNSMSGTGLILFLILSPIVLLVLMFLILGMDQTKSALSSVGLEWLSIKEHTFDILKNIFVASMGIVWLIFWLGLANTIQPSILLVLVRWPIGLRGLNLVILTVVAVPFLLVEAAWIRGLLIRGGEYKSPLERIALLSFKVVSKFMVATLLTIILIMGTTAGGVSTGRVVLIGVIWVRILIVQFLAAVLTTWTSHEFENTWSAVILSAFILSLVLVTTVPLV
jgi:hypothetical protein